MKITNCLYLILLIIVACKRDCTKSTDSIKTVSEGEFKLLFPYTGIQQLRFLKNKTDTITFYKSDLLTSYSYTSTQDDCPSSIPLEQKYLTFVDSVEGNSFILFNYVNSSFNNHFRIIINNQTIVDGLSGDFVRPYPPVKSTKILGIKYDTVSSWQNNNYDSVVFKAQNGGLISFTSNKNNFEIIAQ